ncbi:hypothetical protein [Spartinivicinus poritis]|uniref:Uncharacterized protein n=1 Tax=Spartinivicinus poritis TaxID=2994640 RepID=A0ABT5U8G7_9GAMM|nr:hypothetical protein [Spartinivicinus sp. A2-2]MDE1461832.1 hypothetical protein [Spartinivicinus sp. A2-2]
MKKFFIEVFGILLGMLTVVYTTSMIHIDMRQSYYQEAGILPDMDPRLSFTVAVFWAAFALIVVCITELIRWVFEGQTLNFFAALVLGLMSVSFIGWLFFIPAIGLVGCLFIL